MRPSRRSFASPPGFRAPLPAWFREPLRCHHSRMKRRQQGREACNHLHLGRRGQRRARWRAFNRMEDRTAKTDILDGRPQSRLTVLFRLGAQLQIVADALAEGLRQFLGGCPLEVGLVSKPGDGLQFRGPQRAVFALWGGVRGGERRIRFCILPILDTTICVRHTTSGWKAPRASPSVLRGGRRGRPGR